MLNKASAWLKQQFEVEAQQTQNHRVELCTAVLLYEIMRADETLAQAEQQVLKQRLQQHFSLPTKEIDELFELSVEQADQAADFVQFTRIINAECGAEEKQTILDSLWQVAYADGVLDSHEEHLIRRIADLLYLSHSQFIRSKLSAQQSNE